MTIRKRKAQHHSVIVFAVSAALLILLMELKMSHSLAEVLALMFPSVFHFAAEP
jgi:hypothetical protein